jgi:predicted phage terminase large subunit-like protein
MSDTPYNQIIADPILVTKAKLLGSLLEFTRVFYKIRTGRDFVISEPVGRESHIITICRELTKAFYLETNRLLINVPPGFGKSELLIHFVAWAMAHYPDCQFIYVSYSQPLAAKHTYAIKQIIELPHYRQLFGIRIKQDSSAKDNFKTEQGGSIMAFGSSGSITGQDAGLPNLDRFSGAVLCDDLHKPDDVFSATMRESVCANYTNTIFPRPRGINVPIIGIGQRLHEDDIWGRLIKGYDGYKWKKVILKALDEAGNSLNPAIKPVEALRLMQENQPYVFASQYQQDPSPAGGGIFKPEWFVALDEEPEILATFITADTAETDKDYNDATVFSFWGVYKIKEQNVDIDLWGLHWIDCVELRVEPKDLETEFRQFYADCLHHKVKPKLAGIEKKSTGVTLISVLDSLRGLQILDIPRNSASGSKISRFMAIQPYIASKRVSFTNGAKHQQMCIEHCRKITSNNTHRFDDICDTLADAVRMALIDKTVIHSSALTNNNDDIVKNLMSSFNYSDSIRDRAYGRFI